MPAPHPLEFRQRAVELARQGERPVSQIAKSLGISNSCLRNWMAQADAEERVGGDGLTSSEWRCGASHLHPGQGAHKGQRIVAEQDGVSRGSASSDSDSSIQPTRLM